MALIFSLTVPLAEERTVPLYQTGSKIPLVQQHPWIVTTLLVITQEDRDFFQNDVKFGGAIMFFG